MAAISAGYDSWVDNRRRYYEEQVLEGTLSRENTTRHHSQGYEAFQGEEKGSTGSQSVMSSIGRMVTFWRHKKSGQPTRPRGSSGDSAPSRAPCTAPDARRDDSQPLPGSNSMAARDGSKAERAPSGLSGLDNPGSILREPVGSLQLTPAALQFGAEMPASPAVPAQPMGSPAGSPASPVAVSGLRQPPHTPKKEHGEHIAPPRRGSRRDSPRGASGLHFRAAQGGAGSHESPRLETGWPVNGSRRMGTNTAPTASANKERWHRRAHPQDGPTPARRRASLYNMKWRRASPRVWTVVPV